MNLMFAISFIRWGGVNTWMLELAASLQQRGHQVHIAAPRGHLMLKKAHAAGLGVCDRPFGVDFLSAPLWMAELRRRGIQAVLTNTSKENRTVGAAARLLRLPVAQWVGLARDLKRNTTTTRFERTHIVDRFIAECASMRSDILHDFPFIPAGKLIFIRPGKPRRPMTVTREALLQEAGLNPARLHGVVCSQLTQGKGHPELLQAIAFLRDEGGLQPGVFHLSIFHTGKEEAALKALTGALQLQNWVTFHGFSEKVVQYLPAFDLGFLPSHWEGLANNLREYMMAGLCPVVSNLPGSTEVVIRNRNGFVHKTGDVADLADRIRTAIREPGTVEKFRNQAFLDAEEFFGMDASTRKMEHLFLELRLRGSAPPPES